jgi:hypothetical protein
MFDKTKPYTDLLGKTNRIVEATTITGDITSILILDWMEI